MAPAAQTKDQQVDNRLIEEPDGEPICAMLQAVRHLEAVVRDQEALGDASRSTVRSTRVLIKLMEGWCVDHAIRTRHLAIASLRRDDGGDDAILAALRQTLCENRQAPAQEA